MNKEEMVYHLRGRWKEVEEIQRRELRAMTIEEHWQKINSIVLFAMALRMNIERDKSEMEVFARWAKLKVMYESG